MAGSASSAVDTAFGDAASGLPVVELPSSPRAALLWSRGLAVGSILVTLFTLDAITILFADYWLFESLGLASVFWINFRKGAQLYAGAFVLFAAGIVVPAYRHDVPVRTRRFMVNAAFLVASIAAYLAATNYSEFLLGGRGFEFGRTDPVFGIDVGFYAFNLPNLWIAWRYMMWAAVFFLGFSVACASLSRTAREAQLPLSRLSARVALSSTGPTRAAWVLCGIFAAIGMWLTRYDLLLKNNADAASIKRGAQYLDVTGLFSSLNYIWVTTFVLLGVTAAVFVMLRALHRQEGADWRRRFRQAGRIAVWLIVLDFGFKCAVVVRNWLGVKPNEPVIQLPYIARHVDATRYAYRLDKVQEVDFLPNRPGDPLPTADQLLASPTLKNAPLWPGFVSYLERWIDRQHAQRILQTQGSAMVYGPTLELFQQQQKLRTYYNFVNVDSVRYWIGGEEKMFVSAVRETPLYEPVPWLAYWGQRFMLFTHGFGLVMAPAAEITPEGEPAYSSYDIPPKVKYPETAVKEQRIYYGEGSATMAFSNVHDMKELDYPTDQDRAEIVLPESEKTGVRIDSLWKRLVFGWRSGKFWELVFSDLIKPNTRVHYIRTPVDRLARIAPFLFYDSNPYAVAVDGRIVWIVNGMTTSDRYPYSLIEELGDKSDERSPFPRPTRWVNYIEDSVKATVDAATGKITYYAISDDPVIRAWKKIYPGLFTPAEQMPEGVRRQLTYPPQLMHIQFDDLYIYYHMKDPMYFFNMEDMWDDADEVLGPILDSGKAITFSMEPYNCILETGNGVLPAANPKVQYSLAMVFTPEKALNLRGIPIAYQDPPDYGKLTVLQVPKGQYVIGPEQADAAIDQDPFISQNFSWWNRRGTEVIRGHTTLLMVGKEILYVEPIFLRSQQNHLPQLKRVIVVFRGRPFMENTLPEAVRAAVGWHRANAGAPAPAPAVEVPKHASRSHGS
jgi:uncharacterized membrane protein (UPF0182 family)